MHIETCYWSVTIYGSHSEEERAKLRKLYVAARACGVLAGSVGVFEPPSAPDVFVFGALMHADLTDAKRVFDKAGLSIEALTVTDVELGEVPSADAGSSESFKGRSCSNRKHRLSRPEPASKPS